MKVKTHLKAGQTNLQSNTSTVTVSQSNNIGPAPTPPPTNGE
jgi:hypothetical protein